MINYKIMHTEKSSKREPIFITVSIRKPKQLTLILTASAQIKASNDTNKPNYTSPPSYKAALRYSDYETA